MIESKLVNKGKYILIKHRTYIDVWNYKSPGIGYVHQKCIYTNSSLKDITINDDCIIVDDCRVSLESTYDYY